ncbi:hypothetical protein O181_106664 [Austropuccinia psidii MF-1]|uniref:NECAP PHear domain-containing protein n=1 Tax=Austropuccinia psidii MF-1 TaxID=1389203 RepID=A0A9Q3JSK2_9BASI|nr:hypothetical protein [Austropuccinia psidii MF-1]
MDVQDDYESVLWVGRECYVYRLPPRTSTAGYKAAEWGDMEAFLWKGRLRVIEKGTSTPSKCFIQMEDPDSGELFANCPYSLDGKAVEPVLDSSRYYVVRVEDASTGQRAFLGMGFPDRSDSFDFNVSLQDWAKRQRVSENSTGSSSSPHIPPGPKRDFSLKEGQTISINIGGRSTGQATKKNPPSNTFNSSIPPLLPPPPRGS